MKLQLLKLEKEDLTQFKKDMQEAFQRGAIEGNYCGDSNLEILPEKDIDYSLNTAGAVAYKAVDENGNMLGGAIVVINNDNRNHLDFLYVKHGIQSKGIGKFIWNTLENLYPDTEVWETFTPYFEVRNVHFYINCCGFHAVEYFNPHHPEPDLPEDFHGADDDGMFRFEKRLK